MGRRPLPLLLFASAVLFDCAGTRRELQGDHSPFVTHTTTLNRGLTETALDISARLIEDRSRAWTVAVLEFTASGGRTTSFGEFLSQSLDARLAGGNLQWVDRSFIARISKEILLCAQGGAIETCASMGKVHGANVVVTGDYRLLSDRINLFLKAIEVETAKVMFSRELVIEKDAQVRELLIQSGEERPPTVEKRSWPKWVWVAIGTVVVGGVAAGIVVATQSGGKSGPPSVSAGGEGETATVVISAPPPKVRRE